MFANQYCLCVENDKGAALAGTFYASHFPPTLFHIVETHHTPNQFQPDTYHPHQFQKSCGGKLDPKTNYIETLNDIVRTLEAGTDPFDLSDGHKAWLWDHGVTYERDMSNHHIGDGIPEAPGFREEYRNYSLRSSLYGLAAPNLDAQAVLMQQYLSGKPNAKHVFYPMPVREGSPLFEWLATSGVRPEDMLADNFYFHEETMELTYLSLTFRDGEHGDVPVNRLKSVVMPSLPPKPYELS